MLTHRARSWTDDISSAQKCALQLQSNKRRQVSSGALYEQKWLETPKLYWRACSVTMLRMFETETNPTQAGIP